MNTVKVAVGSQNKAKISAVREAFDQCKYSFRLQAVDAPSHVSAMPFSDEETMEGARNRAEYCLLHTDADLAVGLEGGVTETPFGLFLCNWGTLISRSGQIYFASGARLKLPDEVSDEVRKGRELSDVIDEYCQREDIRSHEGAIGIFTNGRMDRSAMFVHVLIQLIGQIEYAQQ